MAMRALRPCKKIGCPNLVESGYCAEHAYMQSNYTKQAHRQYDATRGTSRERGYDHDWERVRAAKLSRSPLCEDCFERGIYIPAAQVHHIKKVKDFPELRLSMDNLRSLCESCHSRRTGRGE